MYIVQYQWFQHVMLGWLPQNYENMYICWPSKSNARNLSWRHNNGCGQDFPVLLLLAVKYFKSRNNVCLFFIITAPHTLHLINSPVNESQCPIFGYCSTESWWNIFRHWNRCGKGIISATETEVSVYSSHFPTCSLHLSIENFPPANPSF